MKKIKFFESAQTTESLIAGIGLAFLILVFPFTFKNQYADITEVRFLFFTALTAFVFAGCLLAKLLRLKALPKLTAVPSVKEQPLSAAFLVFFNAMCLSAAFSSYRGASISGNEGRYMGLLMYLAFAMMFFWISRCYTLSVKTLILIGSACSLIVLLALLQFIDIDLLQLLRGVTLEEMSNFLSVFGNINVYAAYLSTAAPIAMLMSCFAETGKSRLLFLLFSFFGFLGLLTSNSDSCYIAFGAAFLVLFLLTGRSPVLLKRFILLLTTLFCAMIVFSVVFYAAKGIRGRSGITELLTTPPIPYAGAAFCGVLYWLAAKFINTEKRAKRLWIAAVAGVSSCAVALLGAMVYFSVFNTTVNIGYPEKFLRFNDQWGTDRGYVWSRLLRVFRDSPLKEKLFGYGEETVAIIMLNFHGEEMLSTLGYIFDDAHNEFLQYLLTTGLFGLLSYLALLAVTLKTGFAKNGPVLKKALALAVVAYAAQSFFNLLQPISTPYLFMLIGLIGCGSVIPSTVIDANRINTTTNNQEDTQP